MWAVGCVRGGRGGGGGGRGRGVSGSGVGGSWYRWGGEYYMTGL